MLTYNLTVTILTATKYIFIYSSGLVKSQLQHCFSNVVVLILETMVSKRLSGAPTGTKFVHQ